MYCTFPERMIEWIAIVRFPGKEEVHNVYISKSFIDYFGNTGNRSCGSVFREFDSCIKEEVLKALK